jgi:hypothetical protein
MPTIAPSQAPPPAPPTTPVLAQAPSPSVSLEALFARLGDLSQQMVALRAQRDVLGRQLRNMPASGLRVDFEAQNNQLKSQLTQVEMQYEATRAQIGSRLSVAPSMVTATGISVPPPYIPRRGPDPDMIVGMTFALAICIGLPLAIAYARRIWKGTAKSAPTKPDESTSRLERLEHAVDAIAIEIERVAEGQRFVTKVLAQRPVASASAPPRVVPAELPDASLSEAKPFLALGAGPMEPIRVAERQTVKQSITPH